MAVIELVDRDPAAKGLDSGPEQEQPKSGSRRRLDRRRDRRRLRAPLQRRDGGT